MIQRTTSPQPRRRRWRRVLRRCLLVIALVWVAAYATLPWWAPKDYLRRRLTERLARQLNLAISIRNLSLD